MKAKHALVAFTGLCAVLAAFAVTACPVAGANRGGGEGGEATVTFESNGGSAIDPLTVAIGGTIARPTNPTITPTGANANGRFRNWYTDDGTFEQAFDFSGRITGDITLYADWGYRPGDSGPAGGKIIYRSDAGFSILQYNSANTSTGYYLEAAPQDQGWFYWAVRGGNFEGTNYLHDIGAGRRNTDQILTLMSTAPAASAARSASYGGQSDWFLPSYEELMELHRSRRFFDNLRTLPSQSPFIYWSSSGYDYQYAWARNFSSSAGTGTTYQNGEYNVRAVRYL